jgi:hypothetical protein
VIVSVDLTQAGYAVTLQEPDDFRGFKVVAHGLGPDELADALRHVGRMAGEGDAFIDISAVKRLAAERSQRPDWMASFNGMIEYAKTRGWTSPEGDAIRAHCELVTPAV